jgi:P-type E1-E2 ATPase
VSTGAASLSFTDKDLLSYVASAERLSEHPLGKAIVSYYQAVEGRLPDEPSSFQMIPGRGVVATVRDRQILAGNTELLNEHGVSINSETARLALAQEDVGCTVIYVAVDENTLGLIALGDEAREDARQVVYAFNETGIRTVLLTGDNRRAAAAIAGKVGIAEVYAECLPETKLELIDRFQSAGKQVCMVGDGVNDAPALKKAYVGIAMGGIGSDIAIDASDIALVGDDLRFLPHLLALSKKTMHTIRVNLTASMALNFIAIVLAILGILDPIVGALVHNVGSVVVILNSSLLLRWQLPTPSSVHSMKSNNDSKLL